MSDFIPRDVLPELWEEILRRHWTYLDTEESMEKIEERNKLEGCLKEYLCLVPHDQKFFLAETELVLKKSITQMEDFSAYKASVGFESISQYANNLFTRPWRKEYREIKMYSGFYQHEIKSNLIDAEKLFEAMGYKIMPNQTLLLEGAICPDQVTNVSRDAMAAFVECQIMKQIYSGLTSLQLTCSWLDILKFRETHIGRASQAIKSMAYSIQERRFRKEKLLSTENCYNIVSPVSCNSCNMHQCNSYQQQQPSYNNCSTTMQPPQYNMCSIHSQQPQPQQNIYNTPNNSVHPHQMPQPSPNYTTYGQASQQLPLPIPHSKSLEHYIDHNMANSGPHRHSFDQQYDLLPRQSQTISNQHHGPHNVYDCTDSVPHQGCNSVSYNHPYNVSGNRYPIPYNISNQFNKSVNNASCMTSSVGASAAAGGCNGISGYPIPNVQQNFQQMPIEPLNCYQKMHNDQIYPPHECNNSYNNKNTEMYYGPEMNRTCDNNHPAVSQQQQQSNKYYLQPLSSSVNSKNNVHVEHLIDLEDKNMNNTRVDNNVVYDQTKNQTQYLYERNKAHFAGDCSRPTNVIYDNTENFRKSSMKNDTVYDLDTNISNQQNPIIKSAMKQKENIVPDYHYYDTPRNFQTNHHNQGQNPEKDVYNQNTPAYGYNDHDNLNYVHITNGGRKPKIGDKFERNAEILAQYETYLDNEYPQHLQQQSRHSRASDFDSYEEDVDLGKNKMVSNKNQDGVGSFESWDYVFQKLERQGYNKDLGERGDLLVQGLDLDSLTTGDKKRNRVLENIKIRGIQTHDNNSTKAIKTTEIVVPQLKENLNGSANKLNNCDKNNIQKIKIQQPQVQKSSNSSNQAVTKLSKKLPTALTNHNSVINNNNNNNNSNNNNNNLIEIEQNIPTKQTKTQLKHQHKQNNIIEINRKSQNSQQQTPNGLIKERSNINNVKVKHEAMNNIIVSPNEWSCKFCTYLNPDTKRICDMCSKSKDFILDTTSNNTPTCV